MSAQSNVSMDLVFTQYVFNRFWGKDPQSDYRIANWLRDWQYSYVWRNWDIKSAPEGYAEQLFEWLKAKKHGVPATDNIVIYLMREKSDHPIAQRIIELARDHLWEARESGYLVQGILTFNLKMLKETGWTVDSDLKLLYSSEHNKLRSQFRYEMERAFPAQKGWWEHLEQFVSREDISRLDGEGAKVALKRHLRASSLPEFDLLKQLWALPEKDLPVLEFFAGLSFADACLMERYLSSIKQEDVKEAGHQLIGRQWKLNLLRSFNMSQHFATHFDAEYIARNVWPSTLLKYRFELLRRSKELTESLKKAGIGKVARQLTTKILELIESGANLVQIWRFCHSQDRDDLVNLIYDQYWQIVEPDWQSDPEMDQSEFGERVEIRIVGATWIGESQWRGKITLANGAVWQDPDDAHLSVREHAEVDGVFMLHTGVFYGGADYEQDQTKDGLVFFVQWLRQNRAIFSVSS